MAEVDMSTLSTRDKILYAAMMIFGEDPSAPLSVRTIAARAGVSTGSLRHHFPTQRDLQDTVLTSIYDLAIPDGNLHDASLSARERLLDALRQVLAPLGTGEEARKASATLYERFIQPEPTEQVRSAYLAFEREAQRRVEYWLSTLEKEGAITGGDNAVHARFLLTVLNGLTIERSLPTSESLLATETQTLQMAVDAVLNART